MSSSAPPRAPASPPVPDGVAAGRGYYKEHLGDLARRLREAVPPDVLRPLHRRSAARHLLLAARQFALLAALGCVCVAYSEPWIWVPAAALQGIVVLSFIILLHEVVHETVFQHRRPGAYRLLGLVYAAPATISASQFTRWHLDHHDELGSATEDPKRAYLSPKRNARWLKLLYMWDPLESTCRHASLSIL